MIIKGKIIGITEDLDGSGQATNVRLSFIPVDWSLQEAFKNIGSTMEVVVIHGEDYK